MGFLNILFGGAPTKYDAQKYFDYAEKQKAKGNIVEALNYYAKVINHGDLGVKPFVHNTTRQLKTDLNLRPIHHKKDDSKYKQKIPNYQVIREIFCNNIVFQEGMHSLLRCLLCAEKGFTRENNGKTRKEVEEWHFSLKKFGDMKYCCYFCAKIQEYEIKR